MASVAWPSRRNPFRWLSEARSLVRLAPFETLTEAGRAQERYRRVALTTVTSMVAKGFAVLAALVTVPLTLRYLGSERYGLWMAITSAVTLLGFADLGMSNGLLNAVALTHGKDDRQAMMKFVSSAFFLLSGVALVMALVFSVAYARVEWPLLFEVKGGLARAEAAPAVLAFGACFMLGLPLGIVQRVQMGHQEGFANDIWQCVGSLLSLGGVLICIHSRQGLPLLVLAAAVGPLAATALNGAALFGWSRPWLAPRLSNFDWISMRALSGSGFLFCLLQIGYVISFSSDNLILAHFRGASAVPQYAIVQKVFLVIVGIQSAWLAPLWPAYGEAINRGDILWVRRTLIRSVLVVVAVTGVISFVLLAASQSLFGLWVGPDLVPSWPLAVGFAVWAVVQAGGNAVAMYLNGSNALILELCLSLALVAIGTPLKILLCVKIGAVGVVWGQVIAYVLVVALPLVFFMPRLLAKHSVSNA
jgi:O-antigen/teichoic acid export membrane protein